MIPADAEQELCSTTHHTFLMGPWPGAPDGSIRVVELDDEDDIVLILKPRDVDHFIAGLRAAQRGKAIPVDVHDLSTS